MFLSLWTLFVALTLSGIAAYYSVIGLATIFSAAPLPVIIMSASMEVAKVTTAVWLHHYWKRCKWTMKTYLIASVIVLSTITSIGIFGLLSKAHSSQNLVSGNVLSQLAILDEKIQIEKNNIEENRKTLSQMSNGVSETIARSTSESAVGRAFQLRKNLTKERNDIQKSITLSQEKIVQLNDQRAPIAAEMRQVEAEVGPIKYLAAMVYGDNPDTNTLEKAVRWLIIMLVIVFDPLAITMVLAANEGFKWRKEDRTNSSDGKTITHFSDSEKATIISTDTIKDFVSEAVNDEAFISISDDLKLNSIDRIPVEQLLDLNKDIHVNGIKVSAKEASKVWKRLNPNHTLKEQHHLLVEGLIQHYPWEEADFIEKHFSEV
jgi:hypothetical protein